MAETRSVLLVGIILSLLCSLPGYPEDIRMKKEGGVYSVPVLLNGVLKLNFVVDSGAAEVAVPPEVVLTLIHAGDVVRSDFLPGRTYVLADGSQVKSKRFRIRSMKVGSKVCRDITAVISSPGATPLLGQSCLSRLGKWSQDSSEGVFSFGETALPSYEDLPDPVFAWRAQGVMNFQETDIWQYKPVPHDGVYPVHFENPACKPWVLEANLYLWNPEAVSEIIVGLTEVARTNDQSWNGFGPGHILSEATVWNRKAQCLSLIHDGNYFIHYFIPANKEKSIAMIEFRLGARLPNAVDIISIEGFFKSLQPE